MTARLVPVPQQVGASASMAPPTQVPGGSDMQGAGTWPLGRLSPPSLLVQSEDYCAIQVPLGRLVVLFLATKLEQKAQITFPDR